MRQQSAVAANTGTGPDIVIGWSEDPYVYADKIIELSDLAEYLGAPAVDIPAEKYGKKDKTNNWPPFRSAAAPDRSATESRRSRKLASMPSRTTTPPT